MLYNLDVIHRLSQEFQVEYGLRVPERVRMGSRKEEERLQAQMHRPCRPGDRQDNPQQDDEDQGLPRCEIEISVQGARQGIRGDASDRGSQTQFPRRLEADPIPRILFIGDRRGTHILQAVVGGPQDTLQPDHHRGNDEQSVILDQLKQHLAVLHPMEAPYPARGNLHFEH